MREAQRAAEPGRCTLCRETFQHNTRTFYGRLGKKLVVACERCADQLEVIEGMGLQIDNGTAAKAVVENAMQDARPDMQDIGLSDLAHNMAELQTAISVLDKEQAADVAELKKLAGYPDINGPAHFEDTPFKDNDRAWFEANPARTHRARLAFPGEQPDGEAPPDGMSSIVLVRQVKPGWRMRCFCFQSFSQQELDACPERYCHAWFDAIMQRRPWFVPLDEHNTEPIT
jgi:hypothetical protein